MAYDMYIGTEPMANKIDEVSYEVSKTTGAVGVMETAVIAQERMSTKNICGKLDVGFFNVIMSQIAQRLANETAKGKALAMELMQQQKALQNLQNRMTNDYHMISSRYAKLFNSLNTELRNRITELDKPVMHYCSNNVKQLENRVLNLVSGVPVLQSESLSAAQAIAAVRLKNNAQHLIETAAHYVKSEHQQQEITRMLWHSSSTDEVYYAPFILVEENTETQRGILQTKENDVLRQNLGERAYQNARNAVVSASATQTWKTDAEQQQRVANLYAQKVEQANIDPRVKQQMMQLFNQQFTTL